MNIDKFVNDNADKIEKIIFDSQGNVKEIQLKNNELQYGIQWYPYVEPYRPEPIITYSDDGAWTWVDGNFNLEKQLLERAI